MLNKTLPLLIIFLVGFGLKEIRWIRKEEDGSTLSKLLMYLLIPAAILNSVAHAAISPQLLLLPLAGMTVQAVLFALGFLLAPLFRAQEGARRAFLVSFPTMECGTIGFAAMTAVFGADGLACIALFDLGTAVFGSFGIPLLASLLSQQEGKPRVPITTALKGAIATPLLWAFVGGVILNQFHIHVPIVENLFSTVAGSVLFIIMLFVGVECDVSLAAFADTFALPTLAMYLKAACGVTVGVLVSVLLNLHGVERIAVILASSLPISLLTVILAKENNLDSQFLARQLSLALPFSLAVAFCITLIH